MDMAMEAAQTIYKMQIEALKKKYREVE